jgi:hypothetical protein
MQGITVAPVAHKAAGLETNQATMLWHSGARYQGEWVGGFRHGRGSLEFPDGTTYVGQWLEGQPHGPGKWWALALRGEGRDVSD